jgi:hypothetical protein
MGSKAASIESSRNIISPIIRCALRMPLGAIVRRTGLRSSRAPAGRRGWRTRLRPERVTLRGPI